MLLATCCSHHSTTASFSSSVCLTYQISNHPGQSKFPLTHMHIYMCAHTDVHTHTRTHTHTHTHTHGSSSTSSSNTTTTTNNNNNNTNNNNRPVLICKWRWIMNSTSLYVSCHSQLSACFGLFQPLWSAGEGFTHFLFQSKEWGLGWGGGGGRLCAERSPGS